MNVTERAVVSCPVCGKQMECWYDYMDGWLLLESAEQCPDNHYYHHYAYGNNEIWIGDEVIFGHYTDTAEQLAEQHKVWKEKIAQLRKQLGIEEDA